MAHHYSHEARPLQPRATAEVRGLALSAFGSALCNVPASSGPLLSASRTPRGSGRSLRNLPPAELLSPSFDAAGVVVLVLD